MATLNRARKSGLTNDGRGASMQLAPHLTIASFTLGVGSSPTTDTAKSEVVVKISNIGNERAQIFIQPPFKQPEGGEYLMIGQFDYYTIPIDNLIYVGEGTVQVIPLGEEVE